MLIIVSSASLAKCVSVADSYGPYLELSKTRFHEVAEALDRADLCMTGDLRETLRSLLEKRTNSKVESMLDDIKNKESSQTYAMSNPALFFWRPSRKLAT